MRRLPGLSADHSTWRLRLSDLTASQLPACLLAEGERRVTALADLLRNDAALTLWCVCRAARQPSDELRAIGQVAQWLARHALSQLVWSDEQWSDEQWSDEQRSDEQRSDEQRAGEHWSDDQWANRADSPEWARLATSATRVASRVAELARAEQLSESLVEQGYLAGLLHDWHTWLALCGPPRVGDSPATDTPATDTPATDTPATDTPATDTPATDTPATDTPATDTPATDTPATDTHAPSDTHAPPNVPAWLVTLLQRTDSTADARIASLVRQAVSESPLCPLDDLDASNNRVAFALEEKPDERFDGTRDGSRHDLRAKAPAGEDRTWPGETGPPGPDLASELPRLLERLRQFELLEQHFKTALEQEKLAAVKELAYGASHEINNPLANISTRAQTLLRDEPDPERRRKLATINAQAFRAHEMISDLMLFAHPPALQLSEFELTQLIDQVLGELTEQANGQQTELANRSMKGPLRIVADETLVAAAFKSLVRNSLEALGSGGVVEVLAERVEPLADDEVAYVRLEVRDNGPGLTAEVRRHAFDPFYSGREAGRGLGLGLSKCWRVVTMHGGQVEVASQIERGSRFTILLPIQPAVAAATA